MVNSNVASPGALIFKPEPSNGGTHMAVLTATTSVLLLAPLYEVAEDGLHLRYGPCFTSTSLTPP
ncbi:MAG TPA: hypothetical protein VEW94_09715 [Chloroflexia bacterium]|nr:hypothetical protein [Chloroflexia bacterium]